MPGQPPDPTSQDKNQVNYTRPPAGLLVTDEMRAVVDAAVALKSLPVGSQDYTDRSITLGVAVRTYLATLAPAAVAQGSEQCAHNASGEGSSPSRRSEGDR